MKKSDKQFLLDLLDTPSPSGFEAEGQRKWAGYVRSFVDLVDNDHYGNTWGVLEGSAKTKGPRIMLEAHADEIGFMVSYIGENGYLRVTRIGGSDRAIVRGRIVRILGDAGEVKGVIGNTAIHLREATDTKIPKWEDVFIDIGAKDKAAVEKMGIRVGHPAVFAESAQEVGKNRLVGRALDNRIGGYIIAQVMSRLAAARKKSRKKLPASVYAVNAVQEEIGGNGARMVTYRLEPTVAVVLDVTHATDSPGISTSKHGDVKLGNGPSLTHGTANHPAVVKRLMDVAAKQKINIQHEASSRFTGTDTDDVFVSRAGVPSALVSLPMRYMHSTVEMVDQADIESVIKLLTAFCQSVKADDAFRAEIV